MTIRYQSIIGGTEAVLYDDFDIQVMHHIVPQIMGHYHNSLLTHDDGIEYLAEYYGISEHDIVTHRLGSSVRDVHGKLFKGSKSDDRILRNSLARLSVYKHTGGEVFRGCVTVPIEQDGDIVGVYGERIKRQRRGALKSYWACMQAPCWFELGPLQENGHAWLVSNPLYAISSSHYLQGRIIASGGLHYITVYDCEYLAKKGVKIITFLLLRHDMEPAYLGVVTKKLKAVGIKVSSICTSGGSHVGTA